MFHRVVLAFAFAFVGGCASPPSVFNEFNTAKGTSISIDAKQRAVITHFRNPPNETPWSVVCAEPSPDALSALSASTSIDAATLGKALGLALTTQEGTASIGLRTQTITILRDAMYRLCEGYASGALDEIAFARLQRRYQNIMLGLLAIEQLTGAVVANQAAIGGSAGAKLGQSLAQLTVLVQETRGRAVAAKAALDAAKAKLGTTQSDEQTAKDAYEKALKEASGDANTDAVKKAKAALDGKSEASMKAKDAHDKATLDDAKESGELANLETVRKELDRASAFASAAANFSAPAAVRTTLDAAPVNTVSSAVTGIVTTLVERDYTRETCLDTLMSRTVSVLSKNGNTDALELAIRYCAYALEAEAARPHVAGAAVSADVAKLAASRDSFTKAIDDVFARRRASTTPPGGGDKPADPKAPDGKK